MIYDYVCDKCGMVTEVFVSNYNDAREIEKCECGGDAKKVFPSEVNFVFKGSGTFKTGFDGYKRDPRRGKINGKKI